MAISFVLFSLTSTMVEGKAGAQFDYHANNAHLALQTRTQSYIDVLHGARALFYTKDKITRDQFHSFVRELNLQQSFPGIDNLNFAQRVAAQDKRAFEASVRNDTSVDPDGYPEFSIIPPGDRSEYHVLTFIEPMEGNHKVFGFDIASKVATAVALARDTGQLTSSGKLIQINGSERQVGLALRMPLYRRGKPLNTIAERRLAYYGSIGAGFNVNKLMLGAVDKETLGYMRLRLYDTGNNNEQRETGTVDPDRLLFDTDAALKKSSTADATTPEERFVKRVSMSVGSRVWEAEFSANKRKMITGFDTYLPWFVLASGLIATLLLYSVYYSLMSARRHALEIADDMTKDLRTSKANLAEAQHMAHLGSWLLDPVSGSMSWSAETIRIFGMDPEAAESQYNDFLDHIHAEDRERIESGLEKSISSGEEFNTEHRITRRDGSTRWVQTISRPSHNDRRKLLRGTIMDITERKETVDALKRSQELLRELTAYKDRIKEEERKRIAREIHDELGQTLLALRIDVSILDARTTKSHPRLNAKVRAALGYIDATVKTVRTIINNLRPSVLDLGLGAAIEWQVTELHRRTGIAYDLVMSEKELVIDDALATTLFRILQESLTNVIRHANSTRVVIELYEEGGRLVMKISDNGVGIYPDNRRKSNSFGLIGIEERILALDGKFFLDSAPGKGTSLTIFIPLDSQGKEKYSRTPEEFADPVE